ncbi:MAG: aminodeoxychorismate synthase component I, partial [Burkholderiaceae bacterium]
AELQPQAGERGATFFERLRSSLRMLPPAHFNGEADLPFAGGLLGYLAYDFGRRLDAPPGRDNADIRLPDARFGLYDWALISDHQQQASQLVFHPHCSMGKRAQLTALFESLAESEDGAVQPGPAGKDASFALLGAFAPAIDPQAYRRAIARIHAYIQAGDCYQVNYTQRFQAAYRGDPWQAYRALRHACPTPFSGYLNLGGNDAILSLSPERFMRLQERQIETRPIKGTRPRGDTPAKDRMLAQELLDSIKDRAENLMIVDLLRNDIGRSSRIGSVRVPELFSLESYPNVHHLVSSVQAELAEGLDAFDLLAGSFPGGSITGAPKIRAMQIIDELEPHRRSLYCGSLLYVDSRGEMDSSITIRSLLAMDERISCWGGGGIVMDSDWRAEYQESIDKVDVLMKTLERGGAAAR